MERWKVGEGGVEGSRSDGVVVDSWSRFGGLKGWSGCEGWRGLRWGGVVARCGEEELWNMMNNAGKR